MKYLFLDFETQSQADIKTVGTYNYIFHPTTKILCCAYWLTDDPSITPGIKISWEQFPEDLFKEQNITLVAHNIVFEETVLSRFAPQFLDRISKWIDTMALTSINNVRRGLAHACVDCKIGANKHDDGAVIMRRLNSSRKITTIDDLNHQELSDLAIYCKQDVFLTIALYNKLISTFSKQEYAIWYFTHKHNRTGVYIDLELAQKANEFTLQWKAKLPQRVQELTNGQIDSIDQVAKLTEFLHLPDLTSQRLHELVQIETDPIRKELILLRLEGGKKSVSKFKAALDLTDKKGCLRHFMDYHAAATGRYSSKGLQLQNLIKADQEEMDLVIQQIKNDDSIFTKPTAISRLSKAVRGLIIPPEGMDLIKADYAQVEARILAWLVNDETLLQKFANKGKIYEEMAAAIFDKPVELITQEERFYGKSAVLGCGYGMGAEKFQLTYKVDSDLANRCVLAYRNKNKRVCTLWKELEQTVKACIENNQSYKLGKLIVWRDHWRLFIKLPSKRNLIYPYPRVEEGKIHHKTRKQGQFIEVSYWGGTFVENVCQAISRDLLTTALLYLENYENYQFMFSVHDELVYAAYPFMYDEQEFKNLILESKPDWALTLPLDVDTGVHDRYFK